MCVNGVTIFTPHVHFVACVDSFERSVRERILDDIPFIAKGELAKILLYNSFSTLRSQFRWRTTSSYPWLRAVSSGKPLPEPNLHTSNDDLTQVTLAKLCNLYSSHTPFIALYINLSSSWIFQKRERHANNQSSSHGRHNLYELKRQWTPYTENRKAA